MWAASPKGRSKSSPESDEEGEPPAAVGAAAAGALGGGARTPSGCASTAAASSAAIAPARGAHPGLETVHCWSRARSRVESVGATTSEQK